MALPRKRRWYGLYRGLKQGVLPAAGFFCTVLILTGLTVLVAQTLSTFNTGDVLSATLINENFSNIKTTITTNHGIAAPQGAVMAFYLATCPNGWVAADGTNSTPDLRGLFIRGLNDFGTGVRSDGNQDPDGGSRAYTDVAPQGDQYKLHGHPHSGNVAVSGGGAGSHNIGCGCGVSVRLSTPTISNSGGNESRPKNHGLIYCMRKS